MNTDRRSTSNPSPKEFDAEEFDALLVAVLAEDATPAEHEQLMALVAGNAQRTQRYVELTHLHAQLQWSFGQEPKAVGRNPLALSSPESEELAATNSAPSASSPTPRSKSWLDRASRRPVRPALAVAALVMISVVAWMGVTTVKNRVAESGKSTDEHQAPTKPEFVAWLMKAHETQWLDGTEPERTRLMPGQRLAIAKGLIEIQYRTRATVVIEGPAEFYVGARDSGLGAKKSGNGKAESGKEIARSSAPSPQSLVPKSVANSGYLAHGSLVARVEGEKAKGFTIETPSGRVEDHGTEFGVDVQESGAAEFVVLTGKVDVIRDATGNRPRQRIRLIKNQSAFVVAKSATIVRHKKVDAALLAAAYRKRLDDAWPTPAYRIVDVSVTASSEEGEGRRAGLLVDRSGLSGMRHTSSTNDNMWNTAAGDKAPHVVFDLGTIYRLSEIRIWNYNGTEKHDGNQPFHLKRSVGSMDVWVSTTGEGTPATNPDQWQRVRDDQSLQPGTGKDDYETPDRVVISDVRARYVRIDDMRRHDPKFVDPYDVHCGLSEVAFWGRDGGPAESVEDE